MPIRYFLSALIALLLSGCGEREPAVITPPKDAAAVIEPFLKELRAGDKAGAAAYVSSSATDELDTQFAGDHKKLAATAKLTPRFLTKDVTPRYGAGDEVTLVYAGRKNDKWTSATVRVYRYRDEPYKVEYWRVTNAVPVPALDSNVDPKIMKMQQQMMYWMFGGMALLGLFGLALLVWLIRRKPHLIVAPDPAEETRPSAATVGD